MTSGLHIALDMPLSGFDLSLDEYLPSSGVSVLFGPSGAGKTTILRCIAGLTRYPSNRVEFAGAQWQSEGQWLPPHQRQIGYVLQEPSLFPHLSVRQNLLYGARRRGLGTQLAPELIERLALGELLDRGVEDLSVGEQQRIAIARALLCKPRLLLMDEPLSALDTRRKQEVLQHVEAVCAELAIPCVYVTHDMNEVARLADYMLVLARGRCELAAPFPEILNRLDGHASLQASPFSILQGIVDAHDAAQFITQVRVDQLVLRLPLQPQPLGSRVRLQVMAKDVSLSLSRATDSSIINILPCAVTDVETESPGKCAVKLLLGSQILRATITQFSRNSLNLRPGDTVFAQIKAVSFSR